MAIGILNSFIAGLSPDLAIMSEIGIIIIIAAVLAFSIRLIRQPLIPAYILAGILIGPLVLGWSGWLSSVWRCRI